MNIFEEQEKLLCQVSFPWEADLLAQELKKNKLDCRIVKGSREYTAVVLGGTGNPTLVYVDAKDYEKSYTVMKKYFASLNTEEAQKIINPKRYFRKIILFTLLSLVFLPIFFNLLATYNYWLLVNHEPDHDHRGSALIVLISGWILVVFGLVYLLR